MFHDVKALWVDALRSGEYFQAIGKLRRDQGDLICHCALGVLADLAIKTGGVGEWRREDGYDSWVHEVETADEYGTYWMPMYSVPPTQVLEWAGTTYEAVEGVITLNDAEGKSFNEIADYVEENL